MLPIRTYLNNPNLFILSIIKKIPILFTDRFYVKIIYRLTMGKKLDLNNPKTFNEKLQWLKLYNRKPEYTQMVDKIQVKEYVAKIIGEEYIIPTLGIWDHFDEIDFNLLPEKFVLKTNNGGGNNGVVICTDKTIFDKECAKKKLHNSIKQNIYKIYKEWPYKHIKPKIFAETFLEDNKNNGLISDYKFTCFNGYVDNVMVCVDRHINDPKFYFFDKNWVLLPLNRRGVLVDKDFSLSRPQRLNEMFQVASRLSDGISFLRVDLYCVNNKVYFGEMTFFPASGLDKNLLQSTDISFGEKIILNQ